MALIHQKRRTIISLLSMILFAFLIVVNLPEKTETITIVKPSYDQATMSLAKVALGSIKIQNSDSNDDYSREEFGTGWDSVGGCDTRNIILNRDLKNIIIDDKCNVVSGVLNDPYTGTIINFSRGADTSGAVQVDHVVALSNAWQTGAQQITFQKRFAFANDPLELLAVDGPSNQQKSDGDASVWLPANVAFRCQYVARQVAVKQKYSLWVTQPEHDAIQSVLEKCPGQLLPSP